MHLERLLTVLETIAIAGRPLSATEIQSMTELPLPTCYRLLQTLKAQRLLEDPDANSRYVIGERLVRIALLSRTDADAVTVAVPVLREAADDLGEAVFLSRLRERGVSIIDVQTPPNPSISYIHPGLGVRPMHACSCSKVIAAFADEAFRERILKGPMKAYTAQTHTRPQDLLADFEKIRKTGYAECVEEIEVGVSSVAVPVMIDQVGAVFSVGAIGPIRRFNARHRQAVGKTLMHYANSVGASMQLSGRLAAD